MWRSGQLQIAFHSLCFRVRKNVRLQVRRLGELLVAAVEWAHVRAVTGVNPHVRTQVEIQGKPLTTALKGAL